MRQAETALSTSSEANQDEQKLDNYRFHLAGVALNNFELMEEARRKAEANIQENSRLLSLFAKDSSLYFEPSPTAKTFAFYPEENKVELPISWFENDQYNDSELRWAQYHELAHFIDMRKNPEAFLRQFENMQQTADKLTSDYQDKFSNAQPEAICHYFYNQIHTLYNCLDDIYVNNLVGIKAPYYHSGDGAYDVTNIYRKIGYAEPDLTDSPAHQQFIYSLLRDEMVGQQLGLSQVSDEVEAALSKKQLGRSIRDLINQELKPKPGLLVDPEYRYKLIQNFIEPVYIELLRDGLDKLPPGDAPQDQQPQEKQSSEQQNQQSEQEADQSSTGNQHSKENSETSNNSQDDSFDPFNQGPESDRQQNFLDSADEATARQILESFQEQDKVRDMSPQERNQYGIRQQKLKFDREHQITPKMRKEYDKIVNDVSAMRQEMRQFWKSLVGKSIEYRHAIANQQRKGRLNVREFIDQYPQVVASERSGNLNENTVYDRQQLEKITIEQPESIEISLLIDTSSSMSASSKLRAAKEATTLLMLSVKDFNTYLDQTRRETNSRLRANTQVITYSDDFKEVKPFEKKSSYLDNEANIIKTVSKIIPNGSTNDTAALSFVDQGLSSEQLLKIKQQKLKKIIFVITDGVSNNPDDTAKVISNLISEDVLTFGFQIGDVDDSEEEIFNSIWNKQQHTPSGIIIGNDLQQLPKRLTNTLANTLKGIRL